MAVHIRPWVRKDYYLYPYIRGPRGESTEDLHQRLEPYSDRILEMLDDSDHAWDGGR